MHAISVVLWSMGALVLGGFLARLTRLPEPLVQIALGALLHASGLGTAVLDPELFFLLFLPPLLFLDGWRIPNDALRLDAVVMLRLALGLVVFTVLGLGLLIHLLIPALPWAVAFALAAVISPTDPVAVAAIAARTPLPTRLKHVLQGEAMLNDASGLVCMRLAVAAALTGSFSLTGALAGFAWLALAGVAVGVGVAWGVARAAAWASERHGEDGGGQILATLLIPFVAYLLAEHLGGSGILAAVAAGVTMSSTDIWPWRASTRLRRTAVWDTVQTVANGSIFVLLGQQLPALVMAAPQTVLLTGHRSPWWLGGLVLMIVAALAALRFAWVGVALHLSARAARRRGEPPPLSGWRVVMVSTLAGVRGAVTLAGVMTLPLAMTDGTPFPGRDLAVALAAGVIVVSLVLATVALPPVLRGLKVPAAPSDRGAEERARRQAAEAAVHAIHAALQAQAPGRKDAQRQARAAARVIALYRHRTGRPRADDTAAARRRDDESERSFRLVGLRAERIAVQAIGQRHELSDLALHEIVRDIDLQEARHGG